MRLHNKNLATIFMAIVITSTVAFTLGADDWTRFRGPNGVGTKSGLTLPTKWTETENVKWKTELPGLGSSSPIIVGDKLFVTSYTGFGLNKNAAGDAGDLKRHLICINREDGSEVWRTTIDAKTKDDPYKGFIQEHGYASSTPVSDGEHVYAFFGKEGVFAFDMNGQQIWHKTVGFKSDPYKWGGGASPIIHENLVIVNAGIEGNAVLGLDKKTGEEVWKVEDENFTNTWSTPIVLEVNNRKELIISMPKTILGLDPATGNEYWRSDSPLTNTVCSSPVVDSDQTIFVMGGREGQAIAIQPGGNGDVSANAKWKKPLRAGIGTAVVDGDRMYWNSRGIAYCVDTTTGEKLFEERLPKPESNAPGGGRRSPAGDYASPLIADGKVYLFSRTGVTYVLEAGDQFKLLETNSISGDKSLFNSTPAIADGVLYVRSEKVLYCIK